MNQVAARQSTAERRRGPVVSAAIAEFSRAGFHGTPLAAVSARAGISTAYVFKLFPGKEKLFVAALDECFARVEAALTIGATRAEAGSPAEVLDAMAEAYAELIADRQLLMLQVHAQSVAEVPEIGDALRRGLERVTRFVASRSRAQASEVQRFMAFGQLCHLVTTTGLHLIDEPWAHTLADGIRHTEPAGAHVSSGPIWKGGTL
jgi:AcrR family transcriptional regulator